ncbi:hypothetical protein FRC02_007432 [Tulasnella sp. 418]|nr:hypothetical protein FRC02_007432 [Tulasnella sp. 418]
MSTDEVPRSTELLDIGHKCSSPACGLVDFLPIKCQHCALPYCSDHFKPQAHSCPNFDATKHDRVAPECPFCGTPVAFAAGADPNMAMEKHFETKCEVVKSGGLVGMKSRATTKRPDGEPRCGRTRCNKVLMVPIKCPSCYKAFCAEHRLPASHNCKSSSATSSASSSKAATPKSFTPTPATPRSREPTPSVSTSAPSSSTTPHTNAALAAINRAAASTKAAVQSHTSTSSAPKRSSTTSSQTPASTSTTSPSINNPFNKTDRRTRAEDESRRKALKAREKKGILTEADKKYLAELKAAKDDKDCVIM